MYNRDDIEMRKDSEDKECHLKPEKPVLMLLPEAIANHVNISWAACYNVLVANPGWFEKCTHNVSHIDD